MEAIIFDMDGVIVDTEILWQNKLTAFFATVAPYVTTEQRHTIVGASEKMFKQMLADFFIEDITPTEAYQRWVDYNNDHPTTIDYKAIFRQDIWGIIQYAQDQGIKLAVASSSNADVIETVLSTCEIIDEFDYIVSGAAFKESKPHPEIYLYTAEKLGVQPQQCIVIEDSFYGITAANSAGMTVLAYREERFPVVQHHADYIGNDMVALLAEIKRRIK